MKLNGNDQAQYVKMTTTPIPKLINSLAVPTIISMLVTSIYNMADTFFVSQLGTSAAGAVGIVFSLMAIIQAIGFMIGMGSGSWISRLLGQQKKEEADQIASSGFFFAIIFGLLLTIFGLLFIDTLMKVLGATDTILPYAKNYARYILLGAAVMSASFVLNNILRSEGKATLSMIGITAGGILNIVLDPIFIFGFHLGISGAAIATLISQCISFCILLACFLFKKSDLHISIKYLSKTPATYAKIVKNGLPSFSRQGLASIATVALNVNAAVYGDAAVAAMSIVGRIFMFILSAMIGFGQGFQPVIGFNYGAKKYDRVKESFFYTWKVGEILLIILAVVGFFAAPYLLALFRKDDLDVIEIGTFAFRAQCFALALQPLGVVCNMAFQSIGRAWQGTFLASARQGIFFLPLILILPGIIGLKGVQLTQPLADVCTFICCIPFMIAFFRDIKKMEEQMS